MSIRNQNHSLPLLIDAIRRDRIVLPGSRWAFLGNQRLRDLPVRRQSIKPWLEWFGAEVVMWDRNGRDNAITADLRDPIEARWISWADIVCNFGTSEHVETNQLQVFQTIHEVCRVGGQMLHSVPAVGCDQHGKWKYSLSWFHHLATSNNYEVLTLNQKPVPHNRGIGPHLYATVAIRKVMRTPLNLDQWRDPDPN